MTRWEQFKRGLPAVAVVVLAWVLADAISRLIVPVPFPNDPIRQEHAHEVVWLYSRQFWVGQIIWVLICCIVEAVNYLWGRASRRKNMRLR